MFSDIYPAFLLALVVVGGYILDLAIGDPRWMPHPVRWIGRLIALLEKALYVRRAEDGEGSDSASRREYLAKLSGAFLAILVVLGVWIVSASLLYIAYFTSTIAFILLSIYFTWSALSARSLQREASSVMTSLDSGRIEEARERLSGIVGRDTATLDEEDISRAVVETVSENTSDGIIAPLFFLVIGGPPLALAYKAVNTLDSMLGYKNERYLNFGYLSAKLDDVANYLPARITAVLMVGASFALGFNWRGAYKTIRADASNHPSPNAGFPEAAVAGAVGVRLGGPAAYGGVVTEKPFIGGGGGEESGREAVASTIKIMHLTGLAMLALSVIAVVLIRGN